MLEYEGLLNALNNSKNEREIARYLKEHLILIRNACNYSWNTVIIKPEFCLGGDFRVDYIIVSANSCCWDVTLIEMQSHKDKIFIKNGNMSHQLNEAQRQITEWKKWIKEHDQQFREEIADIVGEDEPPYCSCAGVHINAASEIRDFKTYIRTRYVVLIGRRNYLTQEQRTRRNYISEIEIITFDRLLDCAKKVDKGNKEINEKNMLF